LRSLYHLLDENAIERCPKSDFLRKNGRDFCKGVAKEGKMVYDIR
jgi:hypothetical protein